MLQTFFGVVYLITNTQNRKKYVGQTTGFLCDRINAHFYTARDPKNSRHKNPLYYSIRKRGKENFCVEILCSCLSQADLDLMEDLYIIGLQTMDCSKGYNLQRGGSRGKMSEYSKALMRSQRGGKLNSRYRHDVDEQDLAVRYLRGDTLKSMCADLDVSSLFIQERVKLMGLPLRPSGHPPLTAEEKRVVGLRMKECHKGSKNPAFRHDITEKQVLDLYHSGKTLGEIAEELSADYGTVSKRIKASGIKLKSGPRPKNVQPTSTSRSTAFPSGSLRPFVAESNGNRDMDSAQPTQGCCNY